MSRAFVKESASTAPPPERMVSDGPNLVTQEGFARIAAEVARIEAALEREAIRLRADGAMAGQAVLLRETLERDLRYWHLAKARAEIVPPPDGATIAFGSRVAIERRAAGTSTSRKQSFRIVGVDEADPAAGTISYRSPLAQAVLGAREGDVVEMEKPPAEIVILSVGW